MFLLLGASNPKIARQKHCATSLWLDRPLQSGWPRRAVWQERQTLCTAPRPRQPCPALARRHADRSAARTPVRRDGNRQACRLGGACAEAMPCGIDARLEVSKWRHCAPRARDNAQDSRGEGKGSGIRAQYMRNTHSPMLPSGLPNGIMPSNPRVTLLQDSGKKLGGEWAGYSPRQGVRQLCGWKKGCWLCIASVLALRCTGCALTGGRQGRTGVAQDAVRGEERGGGWARERAREAGRVVPGSREGAVSKAAASSAMFVGARRMWI